MTEPNNSQASGGGRSFLASAILSSILFTISYTTATIQRQSEKDEIIRQGKEIKEIKAMMAERNAGPQHPAPR